MSIASRLEGSRLVFLSRGVTTRKSTYGRLAPSQGRWQVPGWSTCAYLLSWQHDALLSISAIKGQPTVHVCGVGAHDVGLCSALQSLAGHQTPVESVTFDVNEEVVAAGAASGSIKLFDLEQAGKGKGHLPR